ncbi:hypothetical protein [Paludisphaera borealis]|uniref:Uncharacterized protein n=1 Tax=Paludisphaera borealis TaxID=1387353 RepID=A0A1U7CXY6_9BACT|nr:hypothetical protein [Paludisphaera borealis]APW63812.1 hypothetical protein BSF38_05389 [Paludisphaera borealis]MDR3623023.1 hypothetical protein [Paludisphaera borealis]
MRFPKSLVLLPFSLAIAVGCDSGAAPEAEKPAAPPTPPPVASTSKAKGKVKEAKPPGIHVGKPPGSVDL